MNVLSSMENHEVEELVFAHDRTTGLKAIIAIADTTLGPALGGTRMYPYKTEEEAVTDVVRLARGMTYKSAAAGLKLGGGKAVIIADPNKDKTEALLRAYGRVVQGLGGRYITAPDVGTGVSDMDIIHQETSYVTGRSLDKGGGGDSSDLTSLTVLMGIKASVHEVFGTDSLADRLVLVQGVGKVGQLLVERLLDEGARVLVADVDTQRAARIAQATGCRTVPSDDVYDTECDILSPNALGGVLNENTIPRLRCRIVAGGANNQLREAVDAQRLQQRGILYAPDYIINCGGVINCAAELGGYDRRKAETKAREVYQTAQRIFKLAKATGKTTAEVADELVRERLELARRGAAIALS